MSWINAVCAKASGRITNQTSIFSSLPVFWSQFSLSGCSRMVIDPFIVLWRVTSISASIPASKRALLRLPAKPGVRRNFYFVRNADLSVFFPARTSRCLGTASCKDRMKFQRCCKSDITTQRSKKDGDRNTIFHATSYKFREC